MYNADSVRSQPALHALALPPPDPLRSEMAAFLIDYVFTDFQDDPPGRIYHPHKLPHTFMLLLYFSLKDLKYFSIQTFHDLSSIRSSMSGLVDEGKEQKDRSAALLHKRNLLAGYCKLVIFGVLDLSAATDIFKHYFKVKAGWCWCWRGQG